jgi:hypothetical protein
MKLSDLNLLQQLKRFILGDPGLTSKQLMALAKLTTPQERLKWYMNNMYDKRRVNWLTTQRPIRSPRFAAMLADPLVAPLIRDAIHEADRKAVRIANLDSTLSPAS